VAISLRDLAIRGSHAIANAGLRLEDRLAAADWPPLDTENDSCVRCRSGVTLTSDQLAGMLRAAARGADVDVLRMEADVMYRVSVGE
jgi:hypothetical protein